MKDMQLRIKEFCEQYSLSTSLEHRLLDLVSEVGEVSKELLKMTDYGAKPARQSEHLAEELGDVLFALITIANAADIDLEKSLEQVLEKYERRMNENGDVSSGA